tara:strand:+ start:455 stop:946 length:492 start_codon:yes stop_codon:yes gene_type:complete
VIYLWYHAATGGLLWALAKDKGTDRFTPWYVDVGGDVAVAYLLYWDKTRPFMHGVARMSGKGAHHLGRQAARAAWTHGARAGVGVANRGLLFAQSTFVLYTSAVAAGYAIGAVAGTAISQHLFGKQGARHALDFYTGKGKYGEYFDIVGNFNVVFNALKQGDI